MVGGVKDDDALAVRLVFLTSMCMRHGRGAEASRVNRIHVTLTIDLCQTRFARLTTLLSFILPFNPLPLFTFLFNLPPSFTLPFNPLLL